MSSVCVWRSARWRLLFVVMLCVGSLACPARILAQPAGTSALPATTLPLSLADQITALTKLLGTTTTDTKTLSDAIAKLTAALTAAATPPQAKDTTVPNSIDTVLAPLIKARCPVDINFTNCNSDLLKTFATALKANLDQNNVTTLTAAQQAAIWSTLTPLLSLPAKDDTGALTNGVATSGIGLASTSIDPKTPGSLHDPSSVVTSANTLIANLTGALQAPGALDAVSQKQRAALRQSTQTNATKMAQLLAALDVSDPRINVLGAWYGNLGLIPGGAGGGPVEIDIARATAGVAGDFCSAARAVRLRCEAQDKCFDVNTAVSATVAAPVTGSSVEITGPSMCGYDPVSYLSDNSEKGLVVYYQCITRSAEQWKVIGADVAHPAVGRDNGDGRLLRAVLRAGSLGGLFCQRPPSQ